MSAEKVGKNQGKDQGKEESWKVTMVDLIERWGLTIPPSVL